MKLMSARRHHPLVVASLLLVFVSISLCVVAHETATANGGLGRDNNIQLGGEKPRLFRMLDFAKFKLLFGKTYKSWTEELARMRIFLAKCFKSFKSVINYKQGKATSYQSINQMSDWTSDEWRNTLIDRAQLKKGAASAEVDGDSSENVTNVQLAAERQAAGIQNEKDVERMMAEVARNALSGHQSDKGLQEIVPSKVPLTRRKRDLLSADGDDELDQVADLMGGLLAQYDRFGHSEDEDQTDEYDDDLEPVMLGDQHEAHNYEALGASEDGDSGRQTRSKARKSAANGMTLFVDHRNCFNKVPNQQSCGSCYNFAATAVLEYHYCMSTGKQVKFSEQMALDCHPDRGCGGGFPWEVLDFSVEHGVERASAYPYFNRRKKCPFGYPIPSDLVPGYWRIKGLERRQVLLSDFEEALEQGPILVQLSVLDTFVDYGGGIDQPVGCVKGDGLHAMVLVGHGRADGIDFWLIRNSYAATWGEQGYWRIAKTSFAACYEDDEDNGFLVEGAIKFTRNRAYDDELMDNLSAKWHERLRAKEGDKRNKG